MERFGQHGRCPAPNQTPFELLEEVRPPGEVHVPRRYSAEDGRCESPSPFFLLDGSHLCSSCISLDIDRVLANMRSGTFISPHIRARVIIPDRRRPLDSGVLG
ncbi:hypothetical protein [Saccharothrix stipae]